MRFIVLSVVSIDAFNAGDDQARVLADTVAGSTAGYIGAVFYCTATASPKLSLCALYLRIFVQRRLRITTWAVIAFLAANCVAFTIVSVLICVPPSYYWTTYAFTGEDPDHQCINTYSLALAFNPPHIVSDVVMLLLPIRTLWRLNVSRAKKIGLVVIFSTGSIGLAGSAARWAVYLTRAPIYSYSTLLSQSTVKYELASDGRATLPDDRPVVSEHLIHDTPILRSTNHLLFRFDTSVC